MDILDLKSCWSQTGLRGVIDKGVMDGEVLGSLLHWMKALPLVPHILLTFLCLLNM